MIINNALVNGEIKTIVIENGIISNITDSCLPNGIDVKGNIVVPGLIDVHTHGCIGHDTMDADFEEMCRFYAQNGTTSWLPTTMTMDYESLKSVCDANTKLYGANILGFHLEGPYISKKYKGAQNEEYIKNPSIEDFSMFNNVKMITIAPELEGSIEFISSASDDCVISLGHTDCDYYTALEAIECGAKCLTHTYNAMPPFSHRSPGPIGAAFMKKIYVQLICDGFHISQPVVLATYKMFGPERVVIISDSLRCTGLTDGIYESGGLTVIVKDGKAKLEDGTIAGSSSTLWECVKTAEKMGIPFNEAIRMASTTPAEMLGIKKGKIEIGYDADLLILDENKEIKDIIIGGEFFV